MPLSGKLFVLGSVHNPDTYFARHVCQRIGKVFPDVSVDIDICLELDYVKKFRALRNKYGGGLYTHDLTYVVLRDDGVYVGDVMALVKLANTDFGITDAEIVNQVVFDKYAREETMKMIEENGKTVVAISFALYDRMSPDEIIKEYGKVLIELYAEYCPMACSNFKLLCTGELGDMNDGSDTILHYKLCSVQRVVPGGWIQCGDIVDGTGANSVAAVGSAELGQAARIPDECFTLDFGAPEGGIVGYARSAAHGNGSQFFITLGPSEWMQYKFEGFGRIIQGYSVLRELENIKTSNQVPAESGYVSVSNAGCVYTVK